MAIISRQHNYLYILAPRTASTAVSRGVLLDQLDGEWLPAEDILDDRGRFVVQKSHSTVDDLIGHGLLEEQDVEELLVFTTVRNPFDSLASLYTKQQATYQDLLDDEDSFVHRQPGYKAMMRIASAGDFGTWLRMYVNVDRVRQLRYEHHLVRHLYWRYLHHVDVVMRLEHLQSDFDHVLERLGIEEQVQIPRTNVTHEKADDWRDLYTTRTRRLVEKAYREDLTRFSYGFD